MRILFFFNFVFFFYITLEFDRLQIYFMLSINLILPTSSISPIFHSTLNTVDYISNWSCRVKSLSVMSTSCMF